jgi:hypothetical protein
MSNFPACVTLPATIFATFDRNAFTTISNGGSISFTRSNDRFGHSWEPVIFLTRQFSGNDKCLIEFKIDATSDGSLCCGFVPTSERANGNKSFREGKGYLFGLDEMAVYSNNSIVKYFPRPANYNRSGIRLFALLLDLVSRTLTLYISEDGTRKGMRYAERVLDIAVDSYRAAISMYHVKDKMTLNGIYCNDTIPAKYSEPIPFLLEIQSYQPDAFDLVENNGVVTFTRSDRVADSWQPVLFLARHFSGNDKCLVEFKIDATKNGDMLCGFVPSSVLPLSDKKFIGEKGYVFELNAMVVYSNYAVVQNMRKFPNYIKAGPRVYSLLLNLETRCLRVYFSDTGLPKDTELLGEVTGIVDAYRLAISMVHTNDKMTLCNVYWNETIPQRYFQL